MQSLSISCSYTDNGLFFLSPHPLCSSLPLSLSLNTYLMQIHCGGQGAKLFAAWPSVNFHFDKLCWIVFYLFDMALLMLFCLLEPSSCAAPHQGGPVSPSLLVLLSIFVISPSLFFFFFFLLSSSSSSSFISLWSSSLWVLCVFTTARIVNPVFHGDKTTALVVTLWTCCHPPFFLSVPTWIDWHTDGLKDIFCSCVCVCVCE